MIVGMELILWSIRGATAAYVLSLTLWLTGRHPRIIWTVGCVLYLVHVIAAFHLQHHWSHDAAWIETARQTRELFGIDWGGGVYFNYLFTVLWTADVVWWWVAPGNYARRPRAVRIGIHVYLAFMFINGVIVFPQGPTRWFGLAALTLLLALWSRRRLHPLPPPPS